VGVAYRGNIPLEDIAVEFQIIPMKTLTESPNPGFSVTETITLTGDISETDTVRLKRAAHYCPVGQALTKGSMVIQDVLIWSNGKPEVIPINIDTSQFISSLPPLLSGGTVQGSYLKDTKEYDNSGNMIHEGEAKVYVEYDTPARPYRWTYQAGHSSNGWVSPPFPFSLGAWAASTVSTLNRLIPYDIPGLQVELSALNRGNSGQSQGDAASGIIRNREVLRKIKIDGSPNTVISQDIQNALQHDPISIAYKHGGIRVDNDIEIELKHN
jgi:hypothetical protein